MRIGILGAGQLSRMLAQAAIRLGATPILLSENADDCASKLGVDRVTDPSALLAKSDVVLFESERVDVEALRRAARGAEEKFFPSLQAISVLQDKLTQKRLLDRLGIATPVWMETTSGKPDWVLKWSMHGYDGLGTLLPQAQTPETVERFFAGAKRAGARVYAEQWVPFTRELALVSCVAPHGTIAFYPLVETVQVKGVCKEVWGPAEPRSDRGAALGLEREARQIATHIARETDLRGVFAIEFFLGKDGRLWVNEIAPRVHNSGHFSMNACEASQFENHVRAALSRELGNTDVTRAFGMLNLLGRGRNVPPSRLAEAPQFPRGEWHVYEKEDGRAGRKIAHFNLLAEPGEDLASFRPKASVIFQSIEDWYEAQT